MFLIAEDCPEQEIHKSAGAVQDASKHDSPVKPKLRWGLPKEILLAVSQVLSMVTGSVPTGSRAETLNITRVASSSVSTRIKRSDICFVLFKPSARLSCGNGYRHCLEQDHLIFSDRALVASLQVLTMQFLHGVPPSPVPGIRRTQEAKQPRVIHFTLRERQLVKASAHLISLPWNQYSDRETD